MRDEGKRNAEIAEQIEPGQGADVFSRFVNFVHGQSPRADRDRRGRGEDERRAEAMTRADQVPGESPFQLADGIRGTAGSHENEIGVEEGF